jgi:hypothetical protein
MRANRHRPAFTRFVLHDEAGVQFLDSPRRREAASGIGSLNKEASDGFPRGFRAGPTTLDPALLVTAEDGSTP